VKELSAANLSVLNDLQLELETAVEKQAALEREEVEDDVESVDSVGTICTEAAHKVVREKLQSEAPPGQQVSSFLVEDCCSGCVKGRAKKVKAAKKEERKKVKASKKELRGKLSKDLEAQVKGLNERIFAVQNE
jgi:hypothetical protein